MCEHATHVRLPIVMRNASVVVALCLAALLASAGALFLGSGLPLPWRGALTRRVYVDLLRGRLPMLRCPYRMGSGSRVALECNGLGRDSAYGVEVWVSDRTVTSIHHAWWVPEAGGHVFADSLMRATSLAYGTRLECATLRAMNVPDREAMQVAWSATHRPAPVARTAEVRVTSGVPLRRGGPAGWAVSLREHDERPPCVDRRP